ncbi:rhodanese-like domain-containing protein [Candidatus Palibaumannia cicadellinicola]|uniref:Rhodanese-related sulfurtransferase n=1 Tax=Candidatus Palibaumannia cicadellinicola TaxID=186490 RepID=A0A0K2BL30_9GAMM|nr:rhodanese-like domain-containing protein [Candidatus Baumannia cicadellinicola]AKZ65763.1 Rhodanese-related sulfurtransferase [Candidatus Baumannia cicadellinicola]
MQEIMQFIHNHTMLVIVWFVLFIAVIFATVNHWLTNVREITSSEAVRLINKEHAVMIDLRSKDDYRQGHINNSLNIADTSIKVCIEKFKHRPIVLIGHRGITSYNTANNMFRAGCKRVYLLKEGVTGWCTDNLPIIKGK